MPEVGKTPFHRFVRAVHRRATLLHCLESAGAGLLVACGFAGALLPVLFWQERDAGACSSVVLGIGLSTGIAAAVMRWPSVGATLARVDDQLRLQNLLGTVWTMQDSSDDDPQFAAMLFHQAERRCQAISPSELALNFYGRRAWTLLGLAVLLVAVGSMMFDPRRTRADVSASRTAFSLVGHEKSDGRANMFSRPGADRSGERAARTPEGAMARPDDETDGAHSAARTGSRKSDPSATNGDGDGSSRTNSSETPESSAASQEQTTGARDAARTGLDAPGAAGFASHTTGTGAGAGNAGRVQPESAFRAAPWQGSGWFEAKTRALDAVQTGRVPDVYRDAVRAYFERGGRVAD